MIVCRSKGEIAKIREAGLIVANALDLARRMMEPGIKAKEIDAELEALIIKNKAKPAFKGYRGYPASTCISVNEVVVHGIPGDRRLEVGQLVGVDVGVELNGYFADAAITFAVGQIDDELRDLKEVGEAALKAGITMAVAGNHLHDVSAAIQKVAEDGSYSVVREFVGHGIGRAMHEEPQIPNYAPSGRGPRLDKGMVLALEPMVNAGVFEVEVMDDKWTVVTKDRKTSVHFEHTIAVTDTEPLILTAL